MTAQELESLMKGVAQGLKPLLTRYQQQLAALEERNQALEQRVLELEAQRVIADVGR